MPRQNCEVRLRRARLAAFAPDPTHVLMITHLTEEVRWIDHLTIVPKDLLEGSFCPAAELSFHFNYEPW